MLQLAFSLAVLLVAEPFPADVPPPGVDTVRTVAVTIDDLPTVRGRTLARKQQITNDLIAALQAHVIPAVGFVNEQKLGEPAPNPADVALLERWLEAGLELGNHAYSHPSLYDTPLDAFQQDVLRGEVVTKRLMAAHGRPFRYFRHPYLNTGPDLATKQAFEAFLAENGYTVAPVTIDNDEYIYAYAYDKAAEAGDAELMARIGAAYLDYMEAVFAHYEAFSRDLLGREPAQTLLLHANALNAAYLGDLAERLKRRGYRFVSLEEALRDPAYGREDTYTGQAGISWLHRWWRSEGRPARWGPEPDDWVMDIAYPDR